MAEICVIIPTKNEAATIGDVIDEIPLQAIQKKGYQTNIIVVDGNSRDNTRQIAEQKGVCVLIEPRLGKGRAIRTALENTDANFIIMLDGDYTYPAGYIVEMLELLSQTYPVVIGSRLRGTIEEGGMSRLNLVGNYLLTFMANALYRTGISDLCTGYWGFRREVVNNLNLSVDGFEFEAELFSQLAKKGYKIGEIPIHFRRRQSPSKLNAIRDGLKIGKILVARRFQQRQRSLRSK